MTIEKLIEHLQVGLAPQHRVIIEGRDSENTPIRFEPYSIRWEHEEVIIEADLCLIRSK